METTPIQTPARMVAPKRTAASGTDGASGVAGSSFNAIEVLGQSLVASASPPDAGLEDNAAGLMPKSRQVAATDGQDDTSALHAAFLVPATPAPNPVEAHEHQPDRGGIGMSLVEDVSVLEGVDGSITVLASSDESVGNPDVAGDVSIETITAISKQDTGKITSPVHPATQTTAEPNMIPEGAPESPDLPDTISAGDSSARRQTQALAPNERQAAAQSGQPGVLDLAESGDETTPPKSTAVKTQPARDPGMIPGTAEPRSSPTAPARQPITPGAETVPDEIDQSSQPVSPTILRASAGRSASHQAPDTAEPTPRAMGVSPSSSLPVRTSHTIVAAGAETAPEPSDIASTRKNERSASAAELRKLPDLSPRLQFETATMQRGDGMAPVSEPAVSGSLPAPFPSATARVAPEAARQAQGMSEGAQSTWRAGMLDLSRPGWTQSLVQHVYSQIGSGRMTLTLNPPQLGRVVMQVVDTGRKIDLRFTTQNVATTALFADAENRIAELMQKSGLTLSTFETATETNDNTGGHNTAGERGRRDQSTRAATPAIVAGNAPGAAPHTLPPTPDADSDGDGQINLLA